MSDSTAGRRQGPEGRAMSVAAADEASGGGP